MASKAQTPSYEEWTLDELKALLDEVGSHYETKKEERRKVLLAELQELGGLPQPTARGTIVRPTSANAGRPVEAKYKDPETGATWSGRGQMAGWLKAKVEAGAKKDDFLVQPELT